MIGELHWIRLPDHQHRLRQIRRGSTGTQTRSSRPVAPPGIYPTPPRCEDPVLFLIIRVVSATRETGSLASTRDKPGSRVVGSLATGPVMG